MKNKQKTIGVNPLDFYLSYNNDKEKNEQNLEEDLGKKENTDFDLKIETLELEEELNKDFQSQEKEINETLKVSSPATTSENNSLLNTISVQQVMNQHIDLQVAEEVKVQKERVTIHVPSELIDKVKNVVYWEPGLTLAAFAELALQRLLDDLEKERGEPFPPRRRHRLFGGRPLK